MLVNVVPEEASLEQRSLLRQVATVTKYCSSKYVNTRFMSERRLYLRVMAQVYNQSLLFLQSMH